MFELRQGQSLGRDLQPDGTGTGFSYFPGYAYDVVTGERLNIFFGENTIFNNEAFSIYGDQFLNIAGAQTGYDMIFNPTSTFIEADLDGLGFLSDISELIAGGQHYVYVDNSVYDECQTPFQRLTSGPPLVSIRKLNLMRNIMWTWMPVLGEGFEMTDGVPVSDVTYRMRVEHPYDLYNATGANNDYPMYGFSTTALAPDVEQAEVLTSALDLINVVPNPYYAYSEYGAFENDQIIKVTNLPPKAEVNIYTLDGKLVRSFTRAEMESPVVRYEVEMEAPYINNSTQVETQIVTSLDWDLQNQSGVPVSTGVYIIHINVEGIGERSLKSFIIPRAFDSQRL